MNRNQFGITGRLTSDAELKYLPSGSAVAEFSVAVNRSWKQGDEWKEEAAFFNCKAFGKLAEAAGEMFTKGACVTVDGYIKQESWERDGKKHSKYVYVANTAGVILTAPRANNGEARPSDGLHFDRPLRDDSAFDKANANVGVSDDVPF